MDTDFNIPQIDRLIGGIQIIRKYVTDAYCCAAEHDIIYCGDYETREQMTQEERDLMERYGWFEESGSWGFFP